MTNLEKYNNAFVTVFEVEVSALNDTFSRDNVENWDSLAHLSLVGEIEDAFDIMLETDEILNLSSYQAGIEVLKNHDISVG